jgi:hypothetical protein
MQCEFCEKEFSTKSSLVYHQKTAKYCLEKQGKINEKYKCCHCEKCFTTYQRVIDHQNNSCKLKEKTKYEKDIVSIKEELATCKKQEKIRLKEKETYYLQQIKEKEACYQQQIKEKEACYQQQIKEKEAYYQQQIKEKDFYLSTFEEKLKESKDLIKDKIETISKLEARLEKFEDSILSKTEKKTIMSTPTPNHTTNNTTNIVIHNNTLNLNDIPKMAAFLEDKLDKEVVAGGQKGLALLLSNTVLKDKYKCVDPSRQNFEFTNELGEVERDVKAKKLTNALIKSDICAKSGEIGMELWKKEDGSTDSLRYEAHSKNVLEMINFTRDNSTFRSELSALTS